MPEMAVLLDWAEFALRWLHVITAIAWIGSSFYFIALDLGLRDAPDLPEGVKGEEWQVHGGGFYHIRKYMVAPDRLPEHLTWFKWESYWTWISGAALMIVVYWFGADLMLIDPRVAELSRLQAIALSAGVLVAGWLIYDVLCRSALGRDDTRLMVVLFVLLVVLSWGLAQLFAGRAALLHIGAVTGTIMTANVFLIIIPNQKVVVADLRAGRAPEPRFGAIAKTRSTHNNYLTLPVLFLMLSNHYPLAFAGPWNWAIASLVFLMGVTIRHYFNTRHAGRGSPWWTWAATVALFLAIVALSRAPAPEDGAAAAAPGPAAERFAAAPGFERAQAIVLSRCSMCHAGTPLWPGLAVAPGGVRLDSAAAVAAQARAIHLQAGLTGAMPPGNVTGITEEERAALRDWYRAGAR